MARTTKTERVVMFEALSSALKAAYPAQTKFVIARQSYTRVELTDTFDACVAASTTTKHAKAEWVAASFREMALHKKAMELRRMLGKFLGATLDDRSPKLRRYGFSPAKIGKKTLAVKRAAAEKAKETRKARGTMGKRQRATIKGKPGRA